MSLKVTQITASRWVILQGFRKQASICFESIWTWMVKETKRPPLLRVVDELLTAMCFSPLYFAYVRLPISPVVTASDASEAGGGLVGSIGLSNQGADLA